MLSQVQVVCMGYLRKVHSVTRRNKVHSCGICEALNVEAFLRIKRSHLRWFGQVTKMLRERVARHILLATSNETGPEVVQGPVGVNAFSTLLCTVLMWSQQT